MPTYHTTEDLGPKQALLPSGSLLARDVVIARSGEQLYAPYEVGETEDAADDDGYIHVQRDAQEVFSPTAMASFEGAPVTLGHPEEAVGPSNWRQLSVGHAQNVRRDGDHLVADLVITDQDAIEAIRNQGWRSISAGYDAEYEPVAKGRMRQRNIVGNHIAVLGHDDEARCGPACMIGDSAVILQRAAKGHPHLRPALQGDPILGRAQLAPGLNSRIQRDIRQHAAWSRKTMRELAAQQRDFWKVNSHHGA
jgi:hypothetical protein